MWISKEELESIKRQIKDLRERVEDIDDAVGMTTFDGQLLEWCRPATSINRVVLAIARHLRMSHSKSEWLFDPKPKKLK